MAAPLAEISVILRKVLRDLDLEVCPGHPFR